MDEALNYERPLAGKDENARLQVAQRVGARLVQEDIATAERQAAEALARTLAEDAIERVRRQLSFAVRDARNLPRDIAMRIAHDVDSVACPFLEVTEVFDDSDWRQLILTISRGARIAVARRGSLSEGLALALTELGDSLVAETLVENSAAPMTMPVCSTIAKRSLDAPWVLDKLAEREDLPQEIIAHLCVQVSSAARAKLERNYNLPAQTDAVVADADAAAMHVSDTKVFRSVPPPMRSKTEVPSASTPSHGTTTALLNFNGLRRANDMFSGAFSKIRSNPVASKIRS